jgi:hypothetical protein
MKIVKIVLGILILLSLFIPSRDVEADIAPPSQPSGSNVVPGEVTMVQMVYERIVIDLRPPWSDGINADVTAKFIMRNQGTVDEQMTVGFPLNSIGDMNFDGSIPKLKDLVVKIDDSLVVVQYPNNDNWLINRDQETLAIDWAAFDVVFPVGQDIVIEINYKQPPTYDAPTTEYDYTLFTGAGWYGAILEGDIRFRLPYTISYGENYWTYEENVWGGLDTETIVENEVRWHFEEFEPQDYYKDNWRVHVIRPKDWERILSAREALINNQYNAELWKELGDAYSNAAIELGGKTYDSSYQAITAYQQSVALSPDWAEAHASLADEYYKSYKDAEFYASESSPPDESLRQGALQELSVALALEPNNKTALDLQEELKGLGSAWEVLPPPTPFATPTAIASASTTPTEIPLIVTVVHTKIVNPPTSTTVPEPTATSLPMAVAGKDENQNETGVLPMIFSALIIFIAGIGVGTFWSKRTKS